MCLMSHHRFMIVCLVAFVLLTYAVYQYEKNKDIKKAHTCNYSKMQVEIMARARNQLMDKLRLAESTKTSVSLIQLVKDIDESMSLVNYLEILPGDFVRPRLSYMTYQHEILFMFRSKATAIEIEFLYPKTEFIQP